jgi:hypothetical protein
LPTSVKRTNKKIKGKVNEAIITKLKKSFRLKCYGHAKNCKTKECLNKIATSTVEETKKMGQMGHGSKHIRVYVY